MFTRLFTVVRLPGPPESPVGFRVLGFGGFRVLGFYGGGCYFMSLRPAVNYAPSAWVRGLFLGGSRGPQEVSKPQTRKRGLLCKGQIRFLLGSNAPVPGIMVNMSVWRQFGQGSGARRGLSHM